MSAFVWSIALRSGSPLPGPDFALQDLVPGIPGDRIAWGTPGAGYPRWHGVAMATILVGLPLLAASPLLAHGRGRLVLLHASTLLMGLFTLLTVTRLGLAYAPATCLLLVALVMESEARRDGAAPLPER